MAERIIDIFVSPTPYHGMPLVSAPLRSISAISSALRRTPAPAFSSQTMWKEHEERSSTNIYGNLPLHPPPFFFQEGRSQPSIVVKTLVMMNIVDGVVLFLFRKLFFSKQKKYCVTILSIGPNVINAASLLFEFRPISVIKVKTVNLSLGESERSTHKNAHYSSFSCCFFFFSRFVSFSFSCARMTRVVSLRPRCEVGIFPLHRGETNISSVTPKHSM